MRPDRKRGVPPSDAKLVERARQGDSEAFEALVRIHLPRAHALAMSIVRDEDEADDICQETFLAALRRMDQLRDPGRFQGWLLRIVRNIALNQLKRDGRSIGLPVDVLEGIPGPASPEGDLREKGVQEELRAAVGHLSGLPKRVFVLHVIEGWDHGEIAAELGISTGASRVHLFLARRLLRSRVPRPILEEA